MGTRLVDRGLLKGETKRIWIDHDTIFFFFFVFWDPRRIENGFTERETILGDLREVVSSVGTSVESMGREREKQKRHFGSVGRILG